MPDWRAVSIAFFVLTASALPGRKVDDVGRYLRLNQVLDAHAFDEFVEAQCAPRTVLLVLRSRRVAAAASRHPESTKSIVVPVESRAR